MSADINGVIAEWLTNVLREIGDPEGLRNHADELKAQAEHVRVVHAQLAAEVGSSSWSGPDYEAFLSSWQEHAKLAEGAAISLQATANRVDEHAERSWEIVKEVIGIALEILEILAIGLILSWIFAGIADLLWVRVAPLIQRIVQIMERYRAVLAEFAEWAEGVGSSAGKVGEKIGAMIGRGVEKVFTEAPDYARAYVSFYLAEATAPALSGQDIAWGDNAWQTALFFGMDIGNNLIKSAVESINFGKRLAGTVEDASAQAGRNARLDLSSESSLAADGAVVEVEGSAARSTDSLDHIDALARGDARTDVPSAREADQGSAPSVRGTSSSAESLPAAEVRASRSHSTTLPQELRLKSEPVATERRAATEAETREGVADSASVREATAPNLREGVGAEATRSAHPSSASSRARQPRISEDGEPSASIRVVRPGADEDALLQTYRGPDMIRTVRPETHSGILRPETPSAEIRLSGEARAGTSIRPTPEAEIPRITQPKTHSEVPRPETPNTETSLRTGADAGPMALERNSLSSANPSEVHLPGGEIRSFEVGSDVDGAAARIDEVLSPRPTVNASAETSLRAEADAGPIVLERNSLSSANPSEVHLPGGEIRSFEVGSDVDGAAARIDEVLSPRPTVNASQEFRSPNPAEHLKGHEPYQKKSLGEAVKNGISEGVLTTIGNLQTNAVIAHINGTDSHITWQQFGLQALGGSLAGVRQTLFHSLPVGERFGYRNELPGSPSIIRWLSSTPISWAYYSMYLTTKQAVLNGVAGQMTPTEITRADGQ